MTPTRILVIGGGGREHALAWKLAGEPGINQIHVAPGNAGIAREPLVTVHPGVMAVDVQGIVALARRLAIELVVIGPESALAAGVADALTEAAIPTFGPTRSAARIETSKAFCREIAAEAGVPMAAGEDFADLAPALDFARRLAGGRNGTAGVVIKADGLAAGKGVTVCDSADAAETALRSIFAAGDTAENAGRANPGDPAAHLTRGAPRVVIEERLEGREASLIGLCDGRDVLGLLPARDHKRLRDEDRGPNTGGMGAYAPLPDLSASAAAVLLDAVHRPILGVLARRGVPFRGALYAGLILTADGPRLLECNARFGDPEAQVLLSTVGVALAPLLAAAARGELLAASGRLGIADSFVPTTGQAAVGIVLAAAGYPGSPRRGDPIDGLVAAAETGALLFHSAIALGPADQPITDGGRVLTIVGRGRDLATARTHAGAAAELVTFAGAQRRRDIATDLPTKPAPALVDGSAPVRVAVAP